LAAHLFCAESYNTAWDAAFQPYPIFITAGARRTSFPFLVAQSRIDHQGKEFVVAEVTLPSNFNTNLLMMFRWFHIIAGIAWVGLLYFFNLVNTAFMKELDSATRGKVLPPLLSRTAWWFRWASVVTVITGLAYWGNIVASDAQSAGTTSGTPMASFFLIWTVAWAVLYACVIPGKGPLDNVLILVILYAVVVTAASWLFLRFNNHGWESNRLLAIGIGGGMGWLMMLNVWGIVWRAQKRLINWTRDNATNGTPIPERAQYLSRQAFLVGRANFVLSFAMLFFMAAASHYPMFAS